MQDIERTWLSCAIRAAMASAAMEFSSKSMGQRILSKRGGIRILPAEWRRGAIYHAATARSIKCITCARLGRFVSASSGAGGADFFVSGWPVCRVRRHPAVAFGTNSASAQFHFDARTSVIPSAHRFGKVGRCAGGDWRSGFHGRFTFCRPPTWKKKGRTTGRPYAKESRRGRRTVARQLHRRRARGCIVWSGSRRFLTVKRGPGGDRSPTSNLYGRRASCVRTPSNRKSRTMESPPSVVREGIGR